MTTLDRPPPLAAGDAVTVTRPVSVTNVGDLPDVTYRPGQRLLVLGTRAEGRVGGHHRPAWVKVARGKESRWIPAGLVTPCDGRAA